MPLIFDSTIATAVLLVLVIVIAIGAVVYLLRRTQTSNRPASQTDFVPAQLPPEPDKPLSPPDGRPPTDLEKTYSRSFAGKNASITFAVRGGKFALSQEGIGIGAAKSGAFRKWVKDCASDFSQFTGSEVNLREMAAGLLDDSGAKPVTSDEGGTVSADFQSSGDAQEMAFSATIAGSRTKMVATEMNGGFSASLQGIGYSKLKSNHAAFAGFLSNSSVALSAALGKKAVIQATPDPALKQYRLRVLVG